MKIYEDKEKTKEVEILDLGIVPAGEERIFTFYVYNDTEAVLQRLKFSVDHKEVDVVKAPDTLRRIEIAELKLKWKPSITLKQGLKAILNISGKELWS